MCGVRARTTGAQCNAEIDIAPSAPGREGPIELCRGLQHIGGPERAFEHLRTRGGRAKLGGAMFQKRRSQRHMLGPANRTIATREILD